MPLNAPKSQPRVLAPEGTHIARCIGLIYLGTVPVEWNGEIKKQEKIRLTWELPDELHQFKDGEEKKPFSVSKEYTLSLGDKSNLLPIVEGIINASLPEEVRNSFDVEELVGKESLISLKHKKTNKGTEFVSIEGTSPLMKGQKAPKQINPSKILTYEKWDQEYFDSLPDFIKDTMKKSAEYKKMNGETVTDEETVNPDDIPF